MSGGGASLPVVASQRRRAGIQGPVDRGTPNLKRSWQSPTGASLDPSRQGFPRPVSIAGGPYIRPLGLGDTLQLALAPHVGFELG